MEAARGKLQEVGQAAQQKLESASEKTTEALHVAREKFESAGSQLLQWTRENPATALATFFASGFVIGCALTMSKHEKSFSERFSDDPAATLRDAVYSALAPLRARAHDATDAARSFAEDVVDRATHAANGHSWSSRLRNLWS